MTKKRKEVDTATASREELVREIERLRVSRAALQQHNREVTKYTGLVNDAVARLASDGSLAFQAMAEKAGVRSHPSVTEVVRLFDSLVGCQWDSGKEVPAVAFPDDWELDGPEAWSGDADMHLNSPIAELIEIIEHLRFSIPLASHQALEKAAVKVDRAMRAHIHGIKSRHGFVSKTVDVRDAPHGIGWAILDLAQDMSFANTMLRRDLRAAVYRRVCADLYALSNAEFAEGPSNFDVKVLGGDIPF